MVILIIEVVADIADCHQIKEIEQRAWEEHFLFGSNIRKYFDKKNTVQVTSANLSRSAR